MLLGLVSLFYLSSLVANKKKHTSIRNQVRICRDRRLTMCARITLKYKKELCGIKEENEQLSEVCKQAHVESHRADISQAVYPDHQQPECLYIKEEAVDKEMPHFNELKEQKYRYIIKVEEKPEYPCVKDEEEVPHDFKQEHDEDVDTSEGICPEQQEPKRNHINEEEENGEVPHFDERKQQKSPFIKKEEDIYKLPSTAFLLKHKDGSQSEASKSAEPSSRRTCCRMITDYDESHCEGSQAVGLLATSSDIDGTSSYGNHYEESGGDLTGHSENKPWKCSQCWKMFAHKSSLKLHQRTHTGEKPFSCSVCGQRFSQKGTLKIHTRTHTDISEGICPEQQKPECGLIKDEVNFNTDNKHWNWCGKVDASNSSLKLHVRIHSGETSFSCSVCAQKFSQKGHLRSHMRTHTGEKPLSCSVCGQRFSQKRNLNIHTRTHTGEKPLSCSDCGQIFTRKESLQKHTRVHTGEKPLSNSVSRQRLSENGSLKKHTKTHTGEKPFSCSVCGQRFSQKGHLKAHARTHTGKKPFSCSVCGQIFSQKAGLYNHKRTHSSEKPFSCSVCCQKFSQKGHLICHMRTHTGEKPFACSDCGQRFSQKSHLKLHTRTHTGEKPFACSDCGQRFSEKGTLKSHTRTHTGEKPFACSVCGQRFSQKAHLRIHSTKHTGEKLYSCSVCCKKFSQNCHLRIHMRTHTGEKSLFCSVCDQRFTWQYQIKNHKCVGDMSGDP